MAAIRFVDRHTARPVSLAAAAGELGADDRRRLARHEVSVWHPGSADEPSMWEMRMAADVEVPSHAHATAEIVYVLEGELRFGSRVCAAGESALVPANTLYGFRVGPQGCRFMLIRGCADDSYITKEEHVAAQRQARASAGTTQGAGVDGER